MEKKQILIYNKKKEEKVMISKQKHRYLFFYYYLEPKQILICVYTGLLIIEIVFKRLLLNA